MGAIKDRNDMNLTESEDIKKRWQEYTEELYNIYKKSAENFCLFWLALCALQPGNSLMIVRWAIMGPYVFPVTVLPSFLHMSVVLQTAFHLFSLWIFGMS